MPSDIPLPPYFRLDPDAALAAIETPTDTDGFARIAEACARGRDDLARRGIKEHGERRLRAFGLSTNSRRKREFPPL